MKNSNGSGSISKLKGKRRKPWVVRFTTGYTSEGKQIRLLLPKEKLKKLYITIVRIHCYIVKKHLKIF